MSPVLSLSSPTIGYGEIILRSFLGRFITVPILVFGLLFISLPSFVLGREFSIVWEKLTQDRLEVKEGEANSHVSTTTSVDGDAEPGTGTGAARGIVSVHSTRLPPLSHSLPRTLRPLAWEVLFLEGGHFLSVRVIRKHT